MCTQSTRLQKTCLVCGITFGVYPSGAQRAKYCSVACKGRAQHKVAIDAFPINHHGICQCGCDGKTLLARTTNREKGLRTGYPCWYLPGHRQRKSATDYVVNPETGCHVWKLGVGDHGYGRVKVAKRPRRAHIVAWEERHGLRPPSLELHHTCENKRCVNPDHLQLLTRREHLRLHRRPSLGRSEKLGG